MKADRPVWRRRWVLATACALTIVVVATLTAYQLAARSLRADVIEALGPRGDVQDVHLGLGRVVVSQVRIRSPAGWPGDSTLRAERITVIPDLRQLLSGHIHVTRVKIENGYISAVRPASGGGLKILPGLLGGGKTSARSPGRDAIVDTVELAGCVVELYDQSLAAAARVRLDDVRGNIEGVHLPQLDTAAKINLHGVIRHASHEGSVVVRGWVNVAHKASDLTIDLHDIALAPFTPYLITHTKVGVNAGTFDLNLHSIVRDNIVNAKGELAVNRLQLDTGNGPLAGFVALPERAVLGALDDEHGQVKLDFELHGNLDNPAFSLTGGLGLRMATALLQGIGLGFAGLVQVFLALFSGFGVAL